MSQNKTDKIATIEDKIKQLENQHKQLIQKQKSDERKARTRRLIQRGAILESVIPNAETYTEEEIGAFLRQTLLTEFANRKLVEVTSDTD